jgi:Cof subfamily protein (haloacid dehalogenase superfamily)
VPYRLLAVDLDGTIVDGRMQISRRSRRALRAAISARVHVTLASGRVFDSVRVFADDLGVREPLICMQGALVRDPTSEQALLRRGVPTDPAHEFVTFGRQQDWDVGLYLDGSLYVERVTPRLRFYAEYGRIHEQMHVVGDLTALLSEEPMKLVVVAEGPGQAARINGQLQRRFAGRLGIVRSFACFIEGTNLLASKGRALSFLAGRLGVAQADTMAIGDNDNDADMVAWAGLGVAMGNASAAVKAAARYIAPPIEEDGAAEAIEHFILDQCDA